MSFREGDVQTTCSEEESYLSTERCLIHNKRFSEVTKPLKKSCATLAEDAQAISLHFKGLNKNSHGIDSLEMHTHP